MTERPPEEYLGDGAYVEFTGYSFVLYTSNGIRRTNEIFLELSAIKRFIKFARELSGREL